jgi:hypothetical protein
MTRRTEAEEWFRREPGDLGAMKEWLKKFARGYGAAETDRDRRFYICGQLEILSDFAETLCPGDQLKPVRHLILALLSLDRGVQPDLLQRPYGAKPSPIGEIEFRARLAAAAQMYRAAGIRSIREAAKRAKRKAGVYDLKWEQIEDWRQQFQKGDPQTDIAAAYYHRLINPGSAIVAGPSESASGTGDPQSDIAAAVRHQLKPGDLVAWSGGALRTKEKYADWLAKTATILKNKG